MELVVRRIHEECGLRLANRKSRVLAVGGGFILILLFKGLRRAYTVRKLKRKIEERRKQRQEEIRALAEKLSDSGLIIDERDALLSLSMKELQQKLRSGTVTADIVLKAYQSRAVQVQHTTNCLAGLIKESEVLAEACDKSISKTRPLHGIPVSLKENYSMKGYDTTGGLASLLGKTCEDEAVIVKVLKAQGAVPFVRTNIPQTMMSTECSNPVYGATVHPADNSRCPGGSSGGEGALIASEGSILGFGSDIGGSIRIPCHMCGVYGLKPTYGRLSSKGLFGVSKGQNLIQACPGPMAQDVHSLVVAMEALLSPLMYELDPTLPRMPFNTEEYRSSRPLRIGYFLDTGVVQSVPVCQRAVQLAKQVLQQQGHTFIQFEPPGLTEVLLSFYTPVVFGDGGKSFLKHLSHDLVDPTCGVKLWAVLSLSRPLRWVVSKLVGLWRPAYGKTIWSCKGVDSVSDWWQLTADLQCYRDRFIQKWQELRLDVLISPGFAYPAISTGFADDAEGNISYTALYNILNFPAGSIPVTKVTAKDVEDLKYFDPRKHPEKKIKKMMTGTKGLPVNVQCVALPFQEERILRLMRDLETALSNQNLSH